MDKNEKSLAGPSRTAMKPFVKKKQPSKYTPHIKRIKKRKSKVKKEPLREGAESGSDDSVHSDSDDKMEEDEPNIMEKPQALPNVLHVPRNSFDLIAQVHEEIALEGLDGITLEALWTRLHCSTGAHLSDSLRIFIWNKLRDNILFRFYALPEKRRKLEVSKRFYEQMGEANGGMLIEQTGRQTQDIYSFESTKIEGVFGSCDTYSTRIDVSDKVVPLTLDEVKVCFGKTMVIVADDKLRSLNLFTQFNDPTILDGYSELQYRVLERIGRSRFNGEITCGKSSIGILCRDARSLFYYRRMLEKVNVIISQPVGLISDGQTQSGTLLQLQRFYSEKKLRKHRVIEFLVNILKAKPQYQIAYTEFIRRVGKEQWQKFRLKSVMKSPELNGIITKRRLPYREIYPNAKLKDWKMKSKNEEKIIWVLQLKYPNINLHHHFSKEDPGSDDSSEEDDTQPMPIDSSLSNVAYKIVFDAGPQGISFKDFIKASGIDYYTSRRLLLSLSNQKILYATKQDFGKQRIRNFVAGHHRCVGANEVVVGTMDQVEDCDDNTIDFIANVLHIDSDNKHYLKQSAAVESTNSFIHNTETTMGEYEAIKLMRSLNTMSAECKVIYENKHSFEKLASTQSDVSIQLPVPSITIDNNISNMFNRRSLIETASSDRAFLNDYEIDTKLVASSIPPARRMVFNEIAFYNVKEIKKFYPILQKYNLLHKETKQPRFKLIFNKTSKLINRLHSNHEHVNYTSTDEEDVDNPEASSMIVNMNDLYEDRIKPDDTNAVKETIIQCFEMQDVMLSDYVLNVETEIETNDLTNKAEKRPHSTSGDDDLLTTKRAKIDAATKETSDCVEPPEDSLPNSKIRLQSLVQMGPNPEVLKEYNHNECEVKIILSTASERYASHTDVFTDADSTQKVIDRSTIIIEYIRFNNIVADTKLLRHVQTIEKMRGYKTVLDKKTMFRIINPIVTQGFIRVAKVSFRVKKFCRSILMFFEPNFNLFPYLNGTIDVAVFSLRTYAKRKLNVIKNIPNSNVNTALPTKHIPTNPNYKSSRFVSYRYGYLQKFSRLQLMHQFIYYLVYDYSGVYKREPADISTYFDDEESFEQLPNIYKNEITWKMFIPPLPQYQEYGDGWVYLADIVLRLPLSVFVRVCSVMYIIPELTDYLNHPVKRHILVKDLPLSIVDALHCNRRYVDLIYVLFCYLCYMGLLQFGPKFICSKLDMYVYVNRRALIYDTTTSDPGYHEVSVKEYEQIQFYFNSEGDITKFWSMMWSISARSKLGYRQSVIGKLITIENIHTKQLMADTMAAVTPDKAVECDIGFIPGNNRGACGYDSALWIHMRKNWTSNKLSKDIQKTRKVAKKESLSSDLKVQFSQENKDTRPNNAGQGQMRKLVAKSRNKPRKQKFVVPEPRVTVRNSKKLVRRLVKPRCVAKVRNKYRNDELDKKLQETYSGVRSKYDATEMQALTVCVEVLQYMKSARQGVTMICIRDFMHRVCKEVAYKKTSSAYRRRLFNLEHGERDLCSQDNPFLRNLNSNIFAQKYYTHFMKRAASNKVTDSEIKIAFLYLAYFTLLHYRAEEPTNSFKDYLTNATALHNVVLMEEQAYYPSDTYVKPDRKEDIKRDTLQSLMHSTLTCVLNEETWRDVLLKAFSIYPEETIRSIVKHMQTLQILSSKKGISSHPINDGVFLVSGKSYQLSFAYYFNQITNYPNIIFQTAWDTVFLASKEAEKGKSRVSIESYENEHILVLFEMSSINTLSYEVEHTTDFLTINPLISDHTVLIKELVRRCGIIVRNIILQSAAPDYKSNFSIQNVENIISKIINSDSSQTLEGAQLIESIVENSQYLDKDMDEDSAYPCDPKQVQIVKPLVDTEKIDSRNSSIYGLKSLLTKGLFPELDDDEKLEELENHFIPKYPNVWIDLKGCNDFITISQHHEQWINIIDDIERDVVYNFTTLSDCLEQHFEEEDYVLAQSLLNFICSKEEFGASLQECFDTYKKFTTLLSFEYIMEKLIELKYIMLHGVTHLTAIHINFIDYWTNPLDSNTSESKYVDSAIDNYRVKLMPWVKVDGTVHIDALENWMCVILSYCLSFPQATVQSIIKRFPYMKPVDILFILKIIQRIGCISLNTYETTTITTTLFSESTYIDLVPAPYHCDISKLTVSVEACAILKLGQALKDLKAA